MAIRWSRIETPSEVLQHRIWEIAAGYEATFRRHEAGVPCFHSLTTHFSGVGKTRATR